MANEEHIRVVLAGAAAIEEWRTQHPNTRLDLSGGKLRRKELLQRNLNEVDLTSADLEWADVRWTDLVHATLVRTNLTQADLFKTDLRESDLRYATLVGTNLEDADLRGANLTGAIIGNTRFLNTNLSAVIGLSQVEHVAPSRIDIDTLGKSGTLPREFMERCGTPEGARDRTAKGGIMRRIGAMIGSPSDATDERQAITEAILRWNAINRAKGLFIEPVKWETHATPGLEGRPQGMINEELVPISDILVAVFRSRAGSPTGKEVSGTIEEIREFMRLGKYVVLYFYEGEVSIGKVDPDQLKTINEFRKEIQQHGLTASYKNINELREHIICHLTGIVEKLACSNNLDEAEAKNIQELLSTLASELISVIILCNEIEQRQINPWLDSLRSQFGSTADSLRHMAASDTAIRQSMTTELEELATVLDEAANLRMHSGSWPQFQGLVKAVYDKATAIKQNRIDNVPLSEESLTEIKCTVNTTQRKLAGLAARAQDMMNQGRLDDLQGEPSLYGYTLLRVSYYNIDVIQPSLSEKVREVGRDLHLIETMRVYCDGGRSVRAIVERIKKNSDELTSLAEAMNLNEANR
jgi:hypothetical protein